MNLRLCMLCLVTANLTDAYYLKYKAPNSKALKDIKGNLGTNRYPRHVHDITQWLRNNRRKQLLLDRKDERVEEFIKDLILLIEESQPTRTGIPKICLENVERFHDKHIERICEGYGRNSKNQLNLVIPIPVRKEEKTNDLEFRRLLENSRRYSSGSSVENRNAESIETRPKRFEIVRNKKRWQHGMSFRDYKDSDEDKEEYRSEEELSTEKPIKKKHFKKKTIKKKPTSAETDNERYSYIQGSRIMKSNRRQNRASYFLPKRYHWNDDELRHLGYYWFEGNSK